MGLEKFFKAKALKLLSFLALFLVLAAAINFSNIKTFAQGVSDRLEVATGGLLIRNPLTSADQSSSLFFISGNGSPSEATSTAAQIKVTNYENSGYSNASTLEFWMPKIQQSGDRPHPVLGTKFTRVFKFDQYGGFSSEHGDFAWDNRPGSLKFQTRSMILTEIEDPVDIQIMRTGGKYPYNRAALTQENANIGQFEWGAFDGDNFRSVALLYARARGVASSTSSPGSMHFATTGEGSTRPEERMIITSSGNIGIGVDTPEAKLDIRGNIRTSGCTGCADLAEDYLSDQNLEAGEVVSIAEDGSAKIKKAAVPYDPKAIGIISSKPAIRISENGGVVISKGDNSLSKDGYPVALSGRVPVKVSTENGSIQPGDYLTSSSTPGVAMKAIQKGSVIGKALESFGGSGVKKIKVFVGITWYSP